MKNNFCPIAYKLIAFSTVLLFSAGSLLAQQGSGRDRGLGSIQLEVTGDFETRVQEAKKLSDLPRIDDTIDRKEPLSYEVLPVFVRTHFNPDALKPAKIRRVPVEKFPRMMVRLGAGNYVTPLAEIAINNERSRNKTWGLDFRHFSTQSGVPNLHYAEEQGINNANGLSENKIGGHYRHFFRNYTFGFNAQAYANRYNYYGIPVLGALNDDFQYGDPDQQRYLGGHAEVELISRGARTDRLFDDAKLGIRTFYDAFGSQENTIYLPSSWTFPAGDRELRVNLLTQYQQSSSDTNETSVSAFTAHLNPHFRGDEGDVTWRLGLHLVTNIADYTRFGMEDLDQRSIFIAPEASFRWKILPGILEVHGGLDFDFTMQSYADLTREVPWLNPGIYTLPTRQWNINAGISGMIIPQLSYELKAAYYDWENRALIYRDPFYYLEDRGLRGLDVLYVDGNEARLSGALTYVANENLQFNSRLRYHRYEFQGELPYHLPEWEGTLGASYRFHKKINARAELFYVGAREAFQQADNPDIDALLAAYWDMNFAVEYNFNNNLTFFLRLHNAFANRYDLYLGYGAQQFLGMLGFTYRL